MRKWLLWCQKPEKKNQLFSPAVCACLHTCVFTPELWVRGGYCPRSESSLAAAGAATNHSQTNKHKIKLRRDGFVCVHGVRYQETWWWGRQQRLVTSLQHRDSVGNKSTVVSKLTINLFNKQKAPLIINVATAVVLEQPCKWEIKEAHCHKYKYYVYTYNIITVFQLGRRKS